MILINGIKVKVKEPKQFIKASNTNILEPSLDEAVKALKTAPANNLRQIVFYTNNKFLLKRMEECL